MSEETAETSPFAPLKVPTFRDLWIANIGTNFGSLVQAVGAAWLMTLISDSAAMVALVQASTTLPIMALSLVSGAVADNFDRRKVMLGAQIFMLLASAGLTYATFAGHIDAWSLLAFTFLIGCGGAFNNPAWQASVRDIVGKELLSSAVLLNGVGFNVTRSVAPAIGGSIVATAGAAVAFLTNALSYIGLIFVVWRWRGPEQKPAAQRESLRSAIIAGLRYVALSPNLMRIYSRGFLFGLAGIVILALLPLVARDLIGGGSLIYGILLGAFGVGAVIGGLTSGRIAQVLSTEQMVRCAFAGFAVSATLCGVSTTLLITLPAVALAGMCWVLALALFNTSVQLATPRWVVGRALSLYQMSTFGGMAAGAWLWGSVTESAGLGSALQTAGGLALVGVIVGLRWPVPPRLDRNLDPLGRWQEPPVELDLVPRSGPISIAVEYLIEEADLPQFQQLMRERQRIRRRDGARQWALLRNVEATSQWIERFELPTWADYVRFHQRTTHEDGVIGEQLRQLHRGKTTPRVRRMLVRDPHSQLN